MTATEEGDSRRSSWSISHPSKQIATRGPIRGRRGLNIPPRLVTRRWKRQPEVLAGAEIRSSTPTQLQEWQGTGRRWPIATFFLRRMCAPLFPPLAVNHVSEEACDSDERTPPASQQRDGRGKGRGDGGRKRDREGKGKERKWRESQLPGPESESHSDASPFVGKHLPPPSSALDTHRSQKGDGLSARSHGGKKKKRRDSAVVITAGLQKASENPRRC